jgi:hypothetical protein
LIGKVSQTYLELNMTQSHNLPSQKPDFATPAVLVLVRQRLAFGFAGKD